jgi:glycosyltransferase involved in cell wall biosynthesis
MDKVLIIQEVLLHYRIPLFNRIGRDSNIQLTVAYDRNFKFNNQKAVNFKTITFCNQKLGFFFKIRHLRKLIKPFDHIIIMGDLHWLPTFIIALLFKKKSKIYFWGIGLSSQDGLKKNLITDKLRFLLNDISSGTILYSPNVAQYYKENVTKKNQVFTARNTIEVQKFPFPVNHRTKIISIGSFKKYKNLGNLIVAFSQVINDLGKNITLDFIGDGEEEQSLKELVHFHNLNDRVIFWGRKENDKDIYPIISEALVCISPTQAGLAVLHSMAFGCPFLTSENAVTGGERFYIENNVNGYFYDGTVKKLAEKILWIVKNPEKNRQVARNAYDFYHNNCNINDFANSFIDIISGSTAIK